jgi:long-chain acyl-CoA synthetase
VTLGVPDLTFGERVVSCVTTEGNGVTSKDVVAYCRERLSPEKVPSHVYLLDEMPRGPAGKIAMPRVREIVTELEAARELASHRVGAAQRSIGSREEVMRQVLDIAARCFHVDAATLRLDAEPETTEGWNSLAHMDFLLALESVYGIQIAPTDMLEIVTLGDAVDFVCGLDRPHGPT